MPSIVALSAPLVESLDELEPFDAEELEDLDGDAEESSSSARQQHGFAFERLVLGLKNLEPGTGSDYFDAPYGAFEACTALSVKTTKRGTVDLADASRIWLMPQVLLDHAEEVPGGRPRLLMVVGHYGQQGPAKVVEQVTEIEFLLDDPRCRQGLLGSIAHSEVQALHVGVGRDLRADRSAAAAFYQRKRVEFMKRCGAVRLNGRLSTKEKGQRRLQCSAAVKDLLAAATDWHTYTQQWRGLPLPLPLPVGPPATAEAGPGGPGKEFPATTPSNLCEVRA